MQKQGSDLMRSKGSCSWLSFFSPFAKFKIYFLTTKELERLESVEVNEKTYSKTLDLSFSRVKKKRELIDLKSVKDLILKSTQSPLNFLHLKNSDKRGPDFINYLSQARRDLSKEAKLCFALDSKRESLIKQLSELDIHSSGEAKAYCCIWQKKDFQNYNIYLGTDEI